MTLAQAQSVADLLRWAITELAPDSESARLDAEVLLAHAANLTRARLHARPERTIEAEVVETFAALIGRRARGEPIAYILGYREFWSLQLNVTPATLIPRPETELLVEEALARLPADKPIRVLDLGTGSGAIALAIAKERPNCTLTALDISPEALAVAQSNAERLQIHNVRFLHSDWFGAAPDELFDMIVANPPYIAHGDPSLTRGDLRFEPDIALSCDAEGLAAAKVIISEGRDHLTPGGWLLVEHGYDQSSVLAALLKEHGWRECQTLRDYAGQPRLVIARAP